MAASSGQVPAETVRLMGDLGRLPAELRLEIYAYLLAAERVEEIVEPDFTDPCYWYCKEGIFDSEEDDDSDNDSSRYNFLEWDQDEECYDFKRVYKFDKSLLTVNKAVGKEARKFFLEHNSFVRVQYNLACFRSIKGTFELPVIADVTGKSIVGQCLSVEVEWTKKIPPCKGALIICLRALPKLCEALRFYGMVEPPPVPVVVSARGEPLSIFCPELSDGTARISVQSESIPERGPLPRAKQDIVLGSLAVIRGGAYEISIEGFEDKTRVEEVKMKALPAVVFPNAYLYDLVHMHKGLKCRTDAYVAAGHGRVVGNRYGVLERWSNTAFRSFEAAMEKHLTKNAKTALEPFYRMFRHFHIDIRLSWVADTGYRSFDVFRAQDLRFLEKYESMMKPRVLSWYRCMLPLVDTMDYMEILETLSGQVEHAKRCIESFESLDVTDEYVQHDLAVLREFVAAVREGREYNYASLRPGEDVSSFADVWRPGCRHRWNPRFIGNTVSNVDEKIPSLIVTIGNLSVWRLPRRVFDSWEIGEAISPSGADFVGWEDRAHLRKLTKEDGRKLHKVQREKGLALTKLG